VLRIRRQPHLRSSCAGSLCFPRWPLYAETSLSIGSRLLSGSSVSSSSPQRVTNAVAPNSICHSRGQSHLDGVWRGPRWLITRSSQDWFAPGVRRVLIYSLTNSPFINQSRDAARVSPSRQRVFGSGPLAPSSAILAGRRRHSRYTVTLNSGQIFVRPANRRPDGVVDFFLPSKPDQKYLIQAHEFCSLGQYPHERGYRQFHALVDMDAPISYRFYRSAVFDAIIGGQIGSFFLQPTGR